MKSRKEKKTALMVKMKTREMRKNRRKRNKIEKKIKKENQIKTDR